MDSVNISNWVGHSQIKLAVQQPEDGLPALGTITQSEGSMYFMHAMNEGQLLALSSAAAVMAAEVRKLNGGAA